MPCNINFKDKSSNIRNVRYIYLSDLCLLKKEDWFFFLDRVVYCKYLYVFVFFLGYNIKADTMEQSYQLYLFILSTTTLFTGMLYQDII